MFWKIDELELNKLEYWRVMKLIRKLKIIYSLKKGKIEEKIYPRRKFLLVVDIEWIN